MSDKAEEETYSVIFASLKHPVRRKILRLLTGGSKTFTEVLEQVDIDSSHLSYHLENLKDLVKKENGKYSLSDFGRAAASLMSRVEEPEAAKGLVLKKWWRRVFPKALFLVMAVLLIMSISANVYMQSLNNQVTSTFVETRYWFASQVSSSLYFLSAMYTSAGWGPPLIFWLQRAEYSNLSILDISARHLSSNADQGHLSLLQLMRVDLYNTEYYQKIDQLFLNIMNFTNAIGRLFSDNRTQRAQVYIGKIYDTIRDKPTAISQNFLNSYGYLNEVDSYGLQLAAEGATLLQQAVKIVLEDLYEEFPFLLT